MTEIPRLTARNDSDQREIDMNEVKQQHTQRFTVSHFNEADFKGDGLRAYSVYRDLGIAAATHGLATAHVIRVTRARCWRRRARAISVRRSFVRPMAERRGRRRLSPLRLRKAAVERSIIRSG